MRYNITLLDSTRRQCMCMEVLSYYGAETRALSISMKW